MNNQHDHDHTSAFSCQHTSCRARRLISASVQDLQSSLLHYGHKDIDMLRQALVIARARQAKTMAGLLESKIKKLEKVEA